MREAEVAMPHDTRIVVYRGREGLRALRDEWCEFTRRQPLQSYYPTFSWHEAYAEALAPDPEALLYVAMRRAGALTAIIPLECTVERIMGLRLRSLRLPEHGHLRLADFAHAGNPGESVRALMALIDEREVLGADVIDLGYVGDASMLARGLNRDPLARQVVTGLGESHFVDCSLPYADAAARLSGHFRRNLGRLTRRAAGMGALRLRSVRGREPLRAALAAFLATEKSGWKGAQGTGSAIACDPALLRFYERIIESDDPAAVVVINLLELDGAPIASQLCLQVGRILFIHKIGYLESHAALAPGNLLVDATLRACCEDPAIDTLSFVTDAHWSLAWAPSAYAVRRYRLFAGNWRGRLGYGLAAGRCALGRALGPLRRAAGGIITQVRARLASNTTIL